jgi:hypothetical protein
MAPPHIKIEEFADRRALLYNQPSIRDVPRIQSKAAGN